MNDYILFTNLKSQFFNHSSVPSWSYIKIDKHDNVRLYYQPANDVAGFTFYAVEFSSCVSAQFESVWQNPSLQVQILVAGYAFFDGLRHVYFHSEKLDEKSEANFDGYLYYPNALTLANLFLELRKLEERFCHSSQLSDG